LIRFPKLVELLRVTQIADF